MPQKKAVLMNHQRQAKDDRREPAEDPFDTARAQAEHVSDESNMIAPTCSPSLRTTAPNSAQPTIIEQYSAQPTIIEQYSAQPTIIDKSPSDGHAYPTPVRNVLVGSSSVESTGGTTGLPMYGWILGVVGAVVVVIIAVFLSIQVVKTHRVKKKLNLQELRSEAGLMKVSDEHNHRLRKKQSFQELHSETGLGELDNEALGDKKIKSSLPINFGYGYSSRCFQKLESEGAPGDEKVKLSLPRSFTYPPRGFQKLEDESLHQSLDVILEESVSSEEMSSNSRLC